MKRTTEADRMEAVYSPEWLTPAEAGELSGGASIAVVAEFLGDTQETVLGTYSHALPRDRELALKVLEGK